MIKNLLMFLLFVNSLHALEFRQVVIWGHKLHSHTHSYIHYGFYKAFNFLGYKTLWLDNNDDISDIDFSETLFITEGQVDQKMPLRTDCYYILHYPRDMQRIEHLVANHRVIFLYQYHEHPHFEHYQKISEPLALINFDAPGIAIPWATDLLPHEIEANKQKIKAVKKARTIYWIGTIGEGWAGNLNELRPFMQACRENRIHFRQKINATSQENEELIQRSYMAPAIVGTWQEQHAYIPCRVFKNISYGQMVMTNSHAVQELFENKLIYNKDTYQLFYDAKKRLEHLSECELFELMDLVKEKHTYINRISTLLNFFDEYVRNNI